MFTAMLCCLQSGYVLFTVWLCFVYSLAMFCLQSGYVLFTAWICFVYSLAMFCLQPGFVLFTARPSGPCWFCLGSPEVEKHLVVSVGTEVSVISSHLMFTHYLSDKKLWPLYNFDISFTFVYLYFQWIFPVLPGPSQGGSGSWPRPHPPHWTSPVHGSGSRWSATGNWQVSLPENIKRI